MKHLFTTRVRVVVALVLLLAVGLSVVIGLTGINLPDILVQGVLTPIRTGISSLTDSARQLYDYMFRFELISAENTALKEQLAKLEDDAREAGAIARENERLRQLLELKEAHEDFQLVDGYIISWSSSDWSSTVTINRGTRDGLDVGMCAITANGQVVGLVSQVGYNYAVIKTVLDSSIEISATLSSTGGTGYNGIVNGGYASGLSGLLRMNYLPSNSVIHNNDQVVTTGSTVYPRGLILGYVMDAGYEETGIAMYALLRPAADIGSLEQVFIVTAYDNG
ncbi:MAG: rod shape-determining protein MreC [Oscillospiraceae bacterium]|nr:rod shape-determining protein MreC [Oscillospiraceae bacterium]